MHIIIEEMPGSPLVKMDETRPQRIVMAAAKGVSGFEARVGRLNRVEGSQPSWLHVFVTELAMLYRLDRRGHEVPAEIPGLDYRGTMVHDGLASDGRFVDAIQPQCNFHLLTRCRELLEIAKGGAARFPLQVKSLLLQGMSIRDRFLSKEITGHRLAILRGKLLASFGKLLNASLRHEGNARLQKILIKHRNEILWCLESPEAIPATNNESDSELRPTVIARKLSG